jgi:hypothetical protein
MLLLMACDDFMTLWGTTFGRLVASIGGFKVMLNSAFLGLPFSHCFVVTRV